MAKVSVAHPFLAAAPRFVGSWPITTEGSRRISIQQGKNARATFMLFVSGS
jgi:hypothetical protein